MNRKTKDIGKTYEITKTIAATTCERNKQQMNQKKKDSKQINTQQTADERKQQWNITYERKKTDERTQYERKKQR